jgi:amino acid adenylation domain-containing protein/non-ribosomal peptide synthase protein (TIGR01720 family)
VSLRSTGHDLVRRFVALDAERRRVFLGRLAEQGIDFSLLPIPAGLCETGDAPLSHVQQGLWFLAQLEPDSAAYHIAGGLRLLGTLDEDALRRSFDALAARHETLRTTFHAEDGRPFQRIHPARPVALRYLAGRSGRYPCPTQPPFDAENVGQENTCPTYHTDRPGEEDARRPFDLENGPLWRVTLVRLAEDCHELSLCLHHLIADGWSLNRLLDEFAELYAAAREGREPRLPPLPIRYADYAVWQRAWLEAGEMERQLDYWKNRLGDEHPPLELPADRPRPAAQSHRGGRVPFRLDTEVCDRLRRVARDAGATPFMVLLASFYALLYRHTGQTDLRVGVPLANRNRTETEGLIGYFVNTLVFRTELDGRLNFREILGRVRQTALDAQAHPDLPFENLVDALRPERSLDRNPLFQVLYNHQHRNLEAFGSRAGLRVEQVERDSGAAQFDLSLDTEEDAAGRIGGVFTYAADLFDAATVERLSARFRRLLQAFLADPGRRLADIPLLDGEEWERLRLRNRWERNEGAEPPVHETIRRQAEAHPEASALLFEGAALCYGELERRSNRLAHRLIRLGVRPETVVGLIVERSFDLVVGALAVLKTGGAYLSLDPDLPEERLAYMLEDAGAGWVLVGRLGLSSMPNDGPEYRPILRFDDDLADEPDTPPAVAIHPENLAYVIYTSGSTGRPKGVAVAHGPLAAHCRAIGQRYGMVSADRALHFATFGFDAAVEQWLVPLMYGASLVVRGPDLWSAEQAYDTLVAEGVTWFDMPPAYVTEIARWAVAQGRTLPLRACSVGGEAVPRDSLALIRRLVGAAPVINGYGPTEAVITPLTWTAEADTECEVAYAPIGTAVGERSAWILDADLNPVPVGVAGELYLGGVGLARGYLNRPGLTAERFVPDPFGTGGQRLYRTGDRTRWWEDGTVEYLGRMDQQVKIRGFRIEPGEIEARLLAHPGVAEAVATVRGQRLVAYVGCRSGLSPTHGEAVSSLIAFLKQHLPDYMVPAQIVILDRLPRLPSGKLDRKALPEPALPHRDEFLAPQTEAERQLAALWRDVLEVERVGVTDNFFELGGDSIVSIQLVSRARRAGWVFTPGDLFRHQTVASLARVARRAAETAAESGPAAGTVGLTPIQAAFFEAAIPRRHHWNQSLLLESRQALDPACLEAALSRLVGHHDSLRLRYRFAGADGWTQVYAAPDDGSVGCALRTLPAGEGAQCAPYEDGAGYLRQTEAADAVATITEQGGVGCAPRTLPASKGAQCAPYEDGAGYLRQTEAADAVATITEQGGVGCAPRTLPASKGAQCVPYEDGAGYLRQTEAADAVATITEQGGVGCALRTLPASKGAQCAPYEDGAGYLWQTEAADAAAIEAIAADAQRSLDLENGPLLRAVHIRLADGGERLLLVIHHLAVDGVSWRILLEDLQTAYEQWCAGQPLRLPNRTASFQTWSEKLREYAGGAELLRELPYWEAQLTAPDLPRDFPVETGSFRDAETLGVRLDAARTRQLLQDAPVAYRTRVNDLLLAALARVLCRWSGSPEVLVELESHGREDLFPGLDITRTVGWFTSVHPVRLRPESDPGASIKAVKEQLRQTPRGGLGYGLLKYLAPPDVRARLRVLPEPRVAFNYFGQFQAAEGLFRPAPESAGPDHDGDAPLPAWLEINGQVYAGELELRWRYSRTMYRAETIRALADDYGRELAALVDHCLGGGRGATPSDFPLARLTQTQLDALPIPPDRLDDLYPLSPMQQGLLFHSLYAPDDRSYVNQLAVDIEGLDPERFERAWREALRRHDILRSAFLWRGEAAAPLQAVHREVDLPLETLDWRGADDLPGRLAELRAGEHARGFDLAEPPLLRLVLVRLDEDRHHLVWTSHHLLLDGWSTSLLLGEVIERHGGGAPRAAAPRFRDYVAWLEGRDGAADERFWRDRLALLDEPTRLADAVAPPGEAADGLETLRLRLDAETTRRLRRFAENQRVTLNTLVQGAWALLLQRYTGQAAVAFGVTVAGRPADLPDAERMLGLFINTLPLVQVPRAGQPAADWLRALQADNLALREHEHTPLYEIQRWYGQGSQPGSGQDLFDTLLVFENYPVDEALRNAEGLRFGLPVQIDDTHYPMTLSVAAGTELDLTFGYRRACFGSACAERLARHFEGLLLGMAEAPERPLGLLSLLSGEERAQIAGWNAPGRGHPFELPVHETIRRQAEARPGAAALVFEGETLSYGELEARANRLAHRLIRRGVRPETVVGLAVERSFDLVVGALAVLKAGGAYLPLDPDQPEERLAYMLEDAGAGWVLVGRMGLSSMPNDGPEYRPILRFDDDLADEPDTPPAVAVHPEHLAYVIYTSGSTGRPKGVAVAHGPLAAHCRAIGQRYGMVSTDRALHFATFGFDAAVEQWLVPLLHGASLVIRGPDLWSAEQAYDTLVAEGVTWFEMPPAYLTEIAQWAVAQGRTLPLRACSVGGEAVPRDSLALIRRLVGAAPIINGYGPTETVITPLTWTAEADTECGAAYAPIGTAVGERSAWILDADLNPVPVGVAGELYLGGVGLARGYLNRPGLTAERFVPDPFGTGGQRLYRTGDRTRWREDGTVEYLGRTDHQVKIRGFRIELGEIEACLLAHGSVAEAAVLARGEGSGRRLVAYVGCRSGLSPTYGEAVSSLTAFLKQHLPDYMVPAQIVILDRLPRLPSGKLDRKALPEPDQPARDSAPPQTDPERALAALWQELLGVERIGRTNDFFELGGHSLLAMKLAGRVKQALGVELTVRRIFEISELAAQAREIERLREAAAPQDLERELADALAELNDLTPEALEALISGTTVSSG